MSLDRHDGSWKYGFCEACRKNAHEDIRMIREGLIGADFWVCPQCGSTKKL